MASLVDRAARFAERAHQGQTRKYTGEPYIVHPQAVANLVESVRHDRHMLAAAWLHDVVEDTPVTLGEIRCEFGPLVAQMVDDLTDVSSPGDGVRAVRRAIDRAHTAQASSRAQTIKLADLIDNTKSITAHDPAFAAIYLQEKRLLLEVLKRGNAILYGIAWEQLRRNI